MSEIETELERQFLAKLAGKRAGGTLENWYLYETHTGKTCCSGLSYHDNRWRDGEAIWTSEVINIFEDKYLETRNTYYLLGKKKDLPSGSSVGGK